MSYTALNLDGSSQSTLSRAVPVRLVSLPNRQSALFWKRVLDIMLSVTALLALAPLMAAIALAVKLASPGKLIYRATRVGLKGRRFVCYKFRTMVANADGLRDSLRTRNEREGPCFKMADDPRITRVGRILRRYSLDELPQLWNVLRGEMSLVGPRPHPLDDIERYRLEHFRRLDVTPGITGLWQVTARRDPSFETNMALDLEYIEHWNLWMDLQILWKTVFVVLHGSGA
jgi:exopolysaccharide biosynthesis polyprenyl glycosylphosphotransferase